MTSAISISGLDSNYPTPGVNNSSQGLRDNFTNIKNNLDTAATEITDLQNKALVKSAIPGVTMNNDMNNGVIANVQTLSFRASTYNLGTNLSGTVTVDCSLGDVHYGKIDTTDNAITLAFSKWAPTGTHGQVEVILTVVAGQKITLPTPLQLKYGTDTIEGIIISGTSQQYVIVPSGVTNIHWVFNSTDCGTTMEIMPVDRPRRATEVRVPFREPMTLCTQTTSPSTGATTMTVNTDLTSIFVAGVRLYTTTRVLIGTVASSSYSSGTTTTTITLAANALVTGTAINFSYSSSKGSVGDTVGDIMMDATYIYTCYSTYVNGSTNIWKRTAIGSGTW
jgi:hypothetical protein